MSAFAPGQKLTYEEWVVVPALPGLAIDLSKIFAD
jgi:hypothetical protein